MFPDTFSPVTTSNQKRRWKLPRIFEPRGLEFRTECQTPDLVGPAPVALHNRLRTSRAKESNVPSSVRTMLLWYVTSAQLHPVLRQFSRRENSAKPSTWKGGNAFGSIEFQVTTTSETSCWEDQRLNRCFGYVLLKTPRPRHSMQARLPIRSVLLPQSCVGGANVPSLGTTGAILQDQCQCHSAPSTGCWPSASLRFRMAATRE